VSRQRRVEEFVGLGFVRLTWILGKGVSRISAPPWHNSNLGNVFLPSPQNPIHHPLGPRLARSRRPPLGTQGVTDLL